MKMKSFSQYLTEAASEATFTFGRFSPPTTGHEKLLNAVAKVGKKGKYFVYASQSHDNKKNPLEYKTKVKWMRKMFPKHARSIIIDTDIKTAFDAITKLYDKGFTKVNMVVGSDRVSEFEALLNKYNGVKGRHGFYNFEGGVNVVSAGERDPDSDGVDGMSASKMRAAAVANDYSQFSKGLPSGFKDGKLLFNDVRSGLGLSESHNFREHLQLKSVSKEREEYIRGKLFNENDEVIIKKTDEVGKITHLGSNYVIVKTETETSRQWLDAIEPINT